VNRTLQTCARQLAIAASLTLAFAVTPATAAWPEKPVRIVHAYPGAPLDAATRYLAEKLAAIWRQPVLVETRPGASEIIAGRTVATASPDGYTLFVGADSNFSSNQYLFKDLPFDPERDLAPVTELFELPFCLIVPGNFPANTVAEYATLMKAEGEKHQYASTGIGGPNHLSMESLNKTLGISVMMVPYKVGPEIVQDLISGRVSSLVAGVFTAAPFVPNGKLKVLAVSGDRRQKAIPNTPTFAEAGYPDMRIGSYVGLAAPRGTPESVLNRIAADVKTVLSTPEYVEKVGDPFGYAPIGSTPQQFAAFLQERRAEAQKQIEMLGLRK